MKHEYDEITDETKISIVVGAALREGDQVIPGTFNPVALTKLEHLIGSEGVVSVHINPQPPEAYKTIAEYLRMIADDLEKEAEKAK